MEVEQFCDLDGAEDNSSNRDYVRWQSSQSTCLALNSLISEAARKRSPHQQYSRDDSPNKEQTETRGQRTPLASTSFSSSTSSSLSRSSSSSTSLFTAASPLNHSSTSSITASHSTLKRSTSTSYQRRSRPLRPTASASSSLGSTPNANFNADLLPILDPTEFIHMCKAISKRIDGPIRSEGAVVVPPKETRNTALVNRRKQQSGIPSRHGKVKLKLLEGNAIANADRKWNDKGKARALDSDSDAVVTYHQAGDSDTVYSANTLGKRDYTAIKNEAKACSSSAEAMPPPPLPVHVQVQTPVPSRPKRLPKPVVQQVSMRTPDDIASASIAKTAKSHTSESATSSLPPYVTPTNTPVSTSTVKLHPLLDPVRQQRRARLTRTISASLALDSQSHSLTHAEPAPESIQSDTSAPDSRSPYAPSPPNTRSTQQMHGRPSANQSLSRLHSQHNAHVVALANLNADTDPSASAIPSRTQQPGPPPPPLGMRRKPAFPLASQNQNLKQEVNRGSKADVIGSGSKINAGAGVGGVGRSVKTKGFKPPLLFKDASSHLSTVTVHSNVVPAEQRNENKKATVTRNRTRTIVVDTDVDMDTDDSNMAAHHPQSPGSDTATEDADMSFGDAVLFDMDMDALEETMRKYD